jgi:hypothetical protein
MVSRLTRGRPRYNDGVSDEREREVQHEPPVLEGEDELPRQPAPPLDPYTPEPGPGRGERRAFRVMRLAVIPVLVVVAIVVIAALR